MLDLAVLTLCHHSVIDYGTYGLWVKKSLGKNNSYKYFERKIFIALFNHTNILRVQHVSYNTFQGALLAGGDTILPRAAVTKYRQVPKYCNLDIEEGHHVLAEFSGILVVP